MKNRLILIFLSLIFILLNSNSFSQSPQQMKYQVIVRDNTGGVIKNKTVSLRFTIVKGTPNGPSVYRETYQPTTNEFGLVTANIGNGTTIYGNFATIEWGKDIYFLKVEMDILGGTNYILMGLSQFMSVPYTFYADKAGTSLTDHDTSSSNELQQLIINGHYLTISKGNTIHIPIIDSSNTNEIQFLKLSNDTLYLSNGGYVLLKKYDNVPAINALYQKIKNDSTYTRSLIQTNSSQIQGLSNDISGIRTKAKADSSYIRSLNTNLSNDLSQQKLKQRSDSTFLKGLIITESGRRSSDSTLLRGLITTETTNRNNADVIVQNHIIADSATLRNLINSNTTSINNIRSKNNSDSTYLKNQINSTNTTLNSEITNRITADNVIRSKSVSDSNYINSRISTTNTNISTETANRIAADNSLRSKQIADSTFFTSGINSNSTQITAINSNLSNNYYSKTNLQTSGQSQVNFGNLSSKPTTISGYGITDAAPLSHVGASGSGVHGLATVTSAGFMSQLDKAKMNLINGTISGVNTGDQTISVRGTTLPEIKIDTSVHHVLFRGTGASSLNRSGDTILIHSTDNNTTYNAGSGLTLTGTTFTAADVSATNEIQALSISHDTIYLSSGGFVKLPYRHYVGEHFGGGIVYYVDYSGQHGLIVSESDTGGNIVWSNISSGWTNAQSFSNGLANSDTIIKQSGHTNSAAKYCLDYTVNHNGVFSDWFLPSSYELSMIFSNAYALGSFTASNYWTSTEYSNIYAWYLNFTNGSINYNSKSGTGRCRCVRGF
jgi:hypothetical protein